MEHTLYLIFFIYSENDSFLLNLLEINMTSRTRKMLQLVLKDDVMPPSNAIFLPEYDSTQGTSNYERNEAINRKYLLYTENLFSERCRVYLFSEKNDLGFHQK